MSFLQKLFGKSSSKSDEKAEIDGGQTEYKGFIISATPYKNEGQLQSCGVISKTVNGENKSYRFIRADRFTNLDDAVAMIHIKGRQIIDEQGERIFDLSGS
ncbi:HlyU family transcriptional regulator [uncultured Bartonella sp.]|uniref:HlyU family transcriptional regulator n=1 Tax=uncultured Bartonella sp. TaxID=104108 RepID=UPI0025E7B252|nr:HlyU family transcriptional regulator [uncultured Bartonella sp.]